MARPVSTIPSIIQRSGVYYASWYDPAERRSRRLSLATRREDEARARFAAFIADQKGGARPRSSVVLGSEAIDAYIAEHVERRAITAGRIRSALSNIRQGFGRRDISTLVEEDFEDYAGERRAGKIGRSGAMDSTIVYEIGLFKAAVAHGVKRKTIDGRSTPIWWMPDRPRPKGDKWLTRGEIDRLLGAATTLRVQNFIHLGYWTAGRKTALLNLRANRVYRAKGEIDLHPPEWPRTRKRNAVVPIVKDLETPLDAMLVFASGDDFLLGSRAPIDAEFAATVRAAGLEDKSPTPHWLRHSRATHLLHAGKQIFHVAGLLADTVATVERVYGHHCARNLKAALE